MRICENGIFRDMTEAEIAELDRQAAAAAAIERSRPYTMEEVQRLMIRQQINSLTVGDTTALRMVEFYPEWAADTAYDAGFKVQRKGRLWRVVQAHTSRAGWEPENAPALWEEVSESHAGTIEDPIPYNGNRKLENGKCYIQDGVIYRCIRNTEGPVYNGLPELIGLYVEMI